MKEINKKMQYIHNNKVCRLLEKNGVVYVGFPKLLAYEKELVHGFSTRIGGVSKDHLSSMNLSFTRGDDRENVLENHRRFAGALEYDETKLVFSDQVHLTRFHKVTQKDCGKGIIRESDIRQIDGLVTNEPGVPIITFYADCVPLFFYDPVRKVIAMAHSGWRGTVERIGAKMTAYMEEEFGCRAADILCEITLLDAGIQREHIDMTDLCTCCNPEIFFSHRASQGKRGNLAGVMMIKEPGSL